MTGSEEPRPRGQSGYQPDDRLGETETLKDSVTPGRMPKEIGRYHVKRVIASGGMGTVYEAVQEHPRRTVAVKVMKHGIASRSAMRRFEYESQILARLRHPGIAQVYEAGTHTPSPSEGEGWGDGQLEPVPFFAMEYIPNAKPLTQYAQEKKLGTRERLDLFGKVCDAVHHGHQKGIIHRDLKPSNVLVDSHGQPRVIDFGVARATDSDMAVTTLQTDVGQLIGTMQYMSPEQCEADPHDLDIRSDVYALGVVLYELLCHKLPYDVSKVAVYEATRMVREHQPTRLSTIDRTLRGDVETIVFKALEKDRERRYQSAVELNQDIKRYLTGEAIIARPPSIVYQLRVFARRNKAFFGAVAAVFVVLVAGVIVSTSLYLRAELSREAEVEQRRVADQARMAEAEQRKTAEAERDRALGAEQAARRQAYLANIAAASAALSANEIAAVRRRLDAVPEELRNWEWGYMYAQGDNSVKVLRGHDRTLSLAAFSADGTRLAWVSADNTLRVWDVHSGKELTVLRGHEGYVTSVAFSPDGARLASGSGDNMVRLWDLATGTELGVLKGHMDEVEDVEFSRDGTRLASGSDDKTIRIWDPMTGAELAVLRGHDDWVMSVAFSPDGSRLASASADKTVRLWDVGTGEELAALKSHDDHVRDVAFSPDGARLASASSDKTVRLWNASTGRELSVLRGHESSVWSLAFSPDGRRLASGSKDGTIRVWDPVNNEVLTILRGHEWGVVSLLFDPDSTQLVSASADKILRFWDAETHRRLVVLGHHSRPVTTVAFSPDGTRVASGSGWYATTVDNNVRLWDPNTGEPLAVLRGHDDGVFSVAFSPDGTLLASASQDGTVRLWDPATAEERAVLRGHGNGVNSVAFSPDGTLLASGSWDKTVRLWEVATGNELDVLRGHEDDVRSVTFSPDGTRVASASQDKTVRLWDISAREERMVLRGHDGIVMCVTFSPQGNRLASAAVDGTIRLWDASSGIELAVLRGHTSIVVSVAFSPDGTRLASCSYDGTVRLWDASTGEELIALRGHQAIVSSAAFSPDDTRLVSGSFDETVRIWDTLPFRVRYEEYQAIAAARPGAQLIVDTLWQEPIDARAIVKQLRENQSLTEPQRRAGLNLLLNRSAQLQDQVHDLHARLVFTDDVVAALEADGSLSSSVHSRAVGIARRKGDKPLRLNGDSWNLVRPPGGTPQAYRHGLRGAEAVVAIEPDNADFLDTLGIAHYRNDRHEDAYGTVIRSDELRRQKGRKSVPRNLVILSMTLFKLGRIKEARAAFQRLETVMSDPEEDWSDNETATALFQECSQLLEGSDAQPEHLESEKVED